MNIGRVWHTLRLYATISVFRRTQYMRDHHIFAALGEGCTIMDRKIPLYANLIRIGSNVHLASQVQLGTHDAVNLMLNGTGIPQKRKGTELKESIGCIEIGDNVFIGARAMVLPNVKIGSNVVIGAGTLVNRDIPDGSVVGGVPARVIGSFEELMDKRIHAVEYPDSYQQAHESVDGAFAAWLWKQFEERRTK